MSLPNETSHHPANPDVERIREILRQVIDPELGMNIVDLGLLYNVEVQPGQVTIDLTMTSPACPMGEIIIDDVHVALDAALPEDCEKTVHLVWEPPWNPSMMAARARAHFGWDETDSASAPDKASP